MSGVEYSTALTGTGNKRTGLRLRHLPRTAPRFFPLRTVVTVHPGARMERIWYQDPRGFMTAQNYHKILPSRDQTFTQQLNTVLRFALLFSVILVILKRDLHSLHYALFAAVGTAALHAVDEHAKASRRDLYREAGLYQDRQGRRCVRPTPDNPFMNMTVADLEQRPDRPKACDITDSRVRRVANAYFEKNLYRDVDDVYNRRSSARQFFTMPVTEALPDQEGFARWLYGDAGSAMKRAYERNHHHHSSNTSQHPERPSTAQVDNV